MRERLGYKPAVMMLGLSFLGIVLIREWEWIRWRRAIMAASEVDLLVVMHESARETLSECIISYRGVEIRMQRTKCGEAGDKVRVVGRPKTIVIGNRKAQKSFVDAENVTTLRLKPKVGSMWWGIRQMTALRKRLLNVYEDSLPSPESGLVAGIVWGADGSMPGEFAEALKKTGLTHVVAASGYNVTVVVGIIVAACVRLLSRRTGVVLAIAAIGLYALLAGGSPPVVRAALMSGLSLLAVAAGKMNWGWWAFGLASGMMLMVSPWLVESISFQLSIAATAGMMVLARPLENWLKAIIPNRYRSSIICVLLELWATTLAASIATWPIQLHYFGQISFLGLLVNPLVLWLVPPITYLGLLDGVLGLLWLGAAEIVAWGLYPLVHLFVVIVVWCARIPYGSFSVSVSQLVLWGWWLLWVGVGIAGQRISHE